MLVRKNVSLQHHMPEGGHRAGRGAFVERRVKSFESGRDRTNTRRLVSSCRVDASFALLHRKLNLFELNPHIFT